MLNNHKCFFKKLYFQKGVSFIHKCSFKCWSIVFFGSDQYSLHSLKALHEYVNKKLIGKLEIVSVNTSCPTYEFAVKNDYKVHMWPPKLTGNYDIGVVVSFGKLIPKNIIDMFPLGIINVHPSLLPRWRGGMPIPHTLKNGDTITGISIMKIDTKFDTGNIILRKTLSIGPNEVLPSLYKRLNVQGTECLLEVLNGLPECLEKSIPQNHKEACYAKVLKKGCSIVNWKEMKATEVYNLYRGLYGLFPLKTTWQGQEIFLLCLSLNDTNEHFIENVTPGRCHFNKKNRFILVQCKEEAIKLCSVKVKHKIYTAENFNKGFISQVSEDLRFFGS